MGVRMGNRRHKHADEIHAWAEGAIIQFKINPTDQSWIDCPSNNPAWSLDKSYRVKPAKKVIKFRNWITKFGSVVVWQLGQGISCPENLPNFVSWVGDWQQIEVEADDNNSSGFEFNDPFGGIRVE